MIKGNWVFNKPWLMYVGFVGISLMLMLFLVSQCSETVPAERRVKDEGVVTFRIGIEYSPTGMYMERDTLGGFGYMMLSELARKEGIGVKFVPLTSFEQAVNELRTGRMDMLVAEVPVTASQPVGYRFTQPVFLDRQVLVQRLDSLGRTEILTQLDLAGRTVTVQRESPAIGRLAALSREIGDTIYVEREGRYSSEQLMMLVASGSKDLAVVNASTAAPLLSRMPEIDAQLAISLTRFQAWALSTADSMRADSLDAMIGRFKLTPEYQALLQRYSLKGVRED